MSPQSLKSQTIAYPDWITPELIQETIEVWSPYYPEPLTDVDAIEILRNMGSLLAVISPGGEVSECEVDQRKAA